MWRPKIRRVGADRRGLRLARPDEKPLSEDARTLKAALDKYGVTTEDVKRTYAVLGDFFEDPERIDQTKLFRAVNEIDGAPEVSP